MPILLIILKQLTLIFTEWTDTLYWVGKKDLHFQKVFILANAVVNGETVICQEYLQFSCM